MESNKEEELDVIISNVVVNFRTSCHLNLRTIAREGRNVIYRPELGILTMQLRKPRITANIWASGKIICTGAASEDDAKRGARRIARILQKLGFPVRFSAYRVVNVMATCLMPFQISLVRLWEKDRSNVRYEPELHPAALYTMKQPKATVKVFSTGSLTIFGPSVSIVATAIQRAYPLLSECRRHQRQTSNTHS